MNRLLVLVLQAALLLIGLGAATFLIWEPSAEGVNANATLIQTYVNAFVICAYAASIPFFVALYQAGRVVGFAGQGRLLSPASVKALRIIRYCALILIGSVALAVVLLMTSNTSDDRAGGVFVGGLIGLISTVIAVTAWAIEGRLRKGMGPAAA